VFVTESQFKLQDAAKNALERDIERKGEDLTIETSKLPDDDLGVSITNIGAVPVQVKEILVLDSDGLLIKEMGEPTFPITLNAQDLTAITIDTNVTVESEETYSARIITGRGNLVSAAYPPQTIRRAVSSEIAKAIGSVAMDTTTLQYSQDGGSTWNDGWSVPGDEYTIWRVNVTNMVDRDIYLSNYSNFLFMKIVSGGGGQIQPETFYITTSPTATTYPNLEDANFLANGGVMLPADGATVVTMYLKLSSPGSGTDVQLASNEKYLTTLELFGKYDSATSSSFYGQSLPFVGVLSS
jgi:hypothetical protein